MGQNRVKRSQGSECGDIWIDGESVFGGIAAALAGMAYLLYTEITMARRRKKRHDDLERQENLADILQSHILIGTKKKSNSSKFSQTLYMSQKTITII